MNKQAIFTASFITGFVSIIIYAWSKILHSEYSFIFLTIGIIATIIYSVIALFEILPSKKIDISEKMMWVLGFLFINTITALIYILIGRKRILRNEIGSR